MSKTHCAGGCRRKIFYLRGSDTAANGVDPKGWATEYKQCTDCQSFFCDSCLAATQTPERCPKCGGALFQPSAEQVHRTITGDMGDFLRRMRGE